MRALPLQLLGLALIGQVPAASAGPAGPAPATTEATVGLGGEALAVGSRDLPVPALYRPALRRLGNGRQVALPARLTRAGLEWQTEEVLASQLVVPERRRDQPRAEILGSVLPIYGQRGLKARYTDWRLLLATLAEQKQPVRLRVMVLRDVGRNRRPLSVTLHEVRARIRADASDEERKLWVTVKVPVGVSAQPGQSVAVLGEGAISGTFRVRLPSGELGWVGRTAIDFSAAAASQAAPAATTPTRGAAGALGGS